MGMVLVLWKCKDPAGSGEVVSGSVVLLPSTDASGVTCSCAIDLP